MPDKLLLGGRSGIRDRHTRWGETTDSRNCWWEVTIGLVHEWLESARGRIAKASELDTSELALSEQDRERLLDLARIAAHASADRTNAPLVCFLAGVAVGRNPELDLAQLTGDAAGERP